MALDEKRMKHKVFDFYKFSVTDCCMITINLLDEGRDRYTMSSNSFYLGRKYDDKAQEYQIVFPQDEIDAGHSCKMIVTACDGKIPVDTISVASGVPKFVRSNLSQYDRIEIGFSFEGEDGYRKNSEIRYFYFYAAQMPDGFVPAVPEVNEIIDKAFVGVQKINGDSVALQFTNLAGEVKGEVDLGSISVATDDVTISKNADGELQTIGVTNDEGATPIGYGQIKEGIKSYISLNKSKKSDYLYEVNYSNINYDFAERYFNERRLTVNIPSGCSSVRNGDFYGRQLDWLYSNDVEFKVGTDNVGGKIAVNGVVGSMRDGDEALTKAFVESGEYSDLYKVLPFCIVDGQNQFGVTASTNVVPRQKNNGNLILPSGTVEKTICQTMLIRFMLDNFKTAKEAVEYVAEHIALYPLKAFVENYDYDQHWMVADEKNTYLIECVNSQIVVTEISERPYITNFYVDGVTFNVDGKVYTPADVPNGHLPTRDNGITSLGSGLERYNLIVDNYESANTASGMRALLNSLFYTRAYNTSPNPANPVWYTEFVGVDGLTVDSTPTQYAPIEEIAGQQFSARTREDSTTWQTVHSVIYNIKDKTMSIVVQEDLSTETTYSFDFATTRTSQLINDGDGTSPFATEDELDAVEDRIDEVEGDIDVVESDINGIKGDIQTINTNIETLSNGLDKVEQDVQELQNDVDGLETAINKNVVNTIGVTTSGDAVSINVGKINIGSGATSSEANVLPLADEDNGGLMTSSDYNQLRQNTADISTLKGQTIRIAYSVKTNPTPQEIETFVISKGYTQDQWAMVAVVVTGTNYVWRYYAGDGWVQQTDVVSKFTNTDPGIITGTPDLVVEGEHINDGKVFAENDGTGSVIGFDRLKARVKDLEDNPNVVIDNVTITKNSSDEIQAVGITDGTDELLYATIKDAISTDWEV